MDRKIQVPGGKIEDKCMVTKMNQLKDPGEKHPGAFKKIE
jgi:hypothetical protein